MIRERREEDLDRLCAILATMGFPPSVFAGMGFEEWLDEHDAERSWVFDMAPVTVAPTKNVVGHVQVYRLPENPATSDLLEYTEKPASDLLAIGKLFVRPDTYEHGIGRYLLKESVRYVQGRGKLPVLDLRGSGFLSTQFYEKLGFGEVPSGDRAVTPMVYTR